MFTDTINKQAFEFTCKAEETAKLAQHEIESHTLPQINNIISSVLAEINLTENYLKMDRLEIDMGDISLYDLGKNETLTHFREILLKQIKDIQYSRKYIEAEKDHDKTIKYSQFQNELELIKSFLLLGDLPWWADKNNPPDIDIIIQKILRSYPQSIKQMLDNNGISNSYITRLFTQLKPSTINKLSAAIPSVADLLAKEKVIDEDIYIDIWLLSATQLKKIRSLFKDQKNISSAKARSLLVKRLMQLRQLTLFKKKPAQEISEQKIFERLLQTLNLQALHSYLFPITTSDKAKQKIDKTTLASIINKLNLFQVYILLQELYILLEKKQLIQTRDKPLFFEGNKILDHDVVTEMGNDYYYSPNLVSLQEASLPENNDLPEGSSFDETTEIHKGKKYADNKSSETLPNESEKETYELETETGNLPTPGNKETETTSYKHDILSGVTQRPNITPESEKVERETKLIAASANKEAAFANKENINKGEITNNLLDGQSKDFKPNELTDADTVLNKTNHDIAKMIAFIMRKLKNQNNFLFNYLLQLNKEQLAHITEIFSHHINESRERKRIINSLFEHPSIAERDVLKLIAGIISVTENEIQNKIGRKKIKQDRAAKKDFSQPSIHSWFNFNQLPVKDLLILKNIFKKEKFETQYEKEVVKKMLNKISYQKILLFKFFAQLPQQEAEQILKSFKNESIQKSKKENRQLGSYLQEHETQKIYIENAGLCLLALYLPGFFKRLGYVENGEFKHSGFAMRAIYILQYIAAGQKKAPEYLLQFNKLLCGIRIDDYITKSIRLTKKEISEADDLLTSVIKNWKALKSTSANGLRESFLKRKGILFETASKWILQVEKKGYDVLLGTIPWGYSMIKFPWMKKFIEVEWQ